MKRFLALGDSYTIGEGVPEGGAWIAQLADALRREGHAVGAPRVIATTGWTTDELSSAMDAAEPLGQHWDLVTLLIGVNNQYRGRDAGEYRDQFTALLDRAIACAGGNTARVMVLSIPDWGTTPFAAREGRDAWQVAAAIDAFNMAAQSICTARGVAFVDITPVSRMHGGEPAMLADDGLHPSAAMHALWAGLALPVARALLATATPVHG